MREGALPVATGAELTWHVALLAAVPDDMRRAFAARDPGAFLDCSGSWSKVAEQMHLHVNTKRHRIGGWRS